MITREQVADLQPGDVVRLVNPRHPDIFSEGQLRADGRRLLFGPHAIRADDGCPMFPDWHLTVVRRAPRPLYVNHPRTEPVSGDVARYAEADGDDELRDCVYVRVRERWCNTRHGVPVNIGRPGSPTPELVLLVDGATGQAVSR